MVSAIAYVAARQLQLQPKLKLIFGEKCATSTSEELGLLLLLVTGTNCRNLLPDPTHFIFAL